MSKSPLKSALSPSLTRAVICGVGVMVGVNVAAGEGVRLGVTVQPGGMAGIFSRVEHASRDVASQNPIKRRSVERCDRFEECLIIIPFLYW